MFVFYFSSAHCFPVYIQVLTSFIQAWNDFGDMKAGRRQEKRCIWLHCKASAGANIFSGQPFFQPLYFLKKFLRRQRLFFYFSQFLGRFFQFIVFPTIFVGLFFSHQFCLRQILFSANFFLAKFSQIFFLIF